MRHLPQRSHERLHLPGQVVQTDTKAQVAVDLIQHIHCGQVVQGIVGVGAEHLVVETQHIKAHHQVGGAEFGDRAGVLGLPCQVDLGLGRVKLGRSLQLLRSLAEKGFRLIELTGRETVPDVLDEIFASFCIGK